MPQTVDFVILGAGIIGLTIARELKRRHPQAEIIVLEKEPTPGRHASGRNSGVLHSGIYYPPGTLKAQVCRQGAQEMAEYHEQHRLPLDRRGKILIATRAEDEPQLTLLAQRAQENGVPAEWLDAAALREREPEAHSATGTALWIPSTAVGSPAAVMHALLNEVKTLGIDLRCRTQAISVQTRKRTLHCQTGHVLRYGHVINTAGLHADQVAHQFGVGQRYTLLPFKGIYWKLNPASGIHIRHLIYPVPDLRVPFLGVHTTTSTDGTTYLGPTAAPAFGRENYQGLQNISARELLRITGLLAKQYLSNKDGFRRLAWQEGRRYYKPWFTAAARAILPRLRPEHLQAADKVGIRAQLLDKHTGRLVTDFLIEQGLHATHILNAISPAWTSAFPFARHVCDHYIERNP